MLQIVSPENETILSTYNIPVSEIVVCDQSMDLSLCCNQAHCLLHSLIHRLSFTPCRWRVSAPSPTAASRSQAQRDQQATKLIFAGSRVNLTEQVHVREQNVHEGRRQFSGRNSQEYWMEAGGIRLATVNGKKPS